MKIIRSSKCSIKYATNVKQKQVRQILNEYKNVVNYFINLFWNNSIEKKDLLKDIVNSSSSWFTHRLKKVAAREAIDMINCSRALVEEKRQELLDKSKKAETEKEKNKLIANAKNLQPKKPKHHGKRMCLLSTVAELQPSKDSLFDSWLHLHSIGNKISIDIPVKFHRHYQKLHQNGERLNYYIVTDKEIQFCFAIETEPKKERKQTVGIDTGVKTLATLSTGEEYGKDIAEIVKRINRCKHGSKRQQSLRNSLKQRMNEVSKEITQRKDIDCIVVEKLFQMNKNSKKNKKLRKSQRKVIGTWAYRYWLDRTQMNCEENRISFRSVYPHYTSVKCSSCGHTDKKNRKTRDIFGCLRCGHIDKADKNAAVNIRDRFLTGPYGAGFKPL
jgi:transposase